MKREREKHITRLHLILFFLVVIIAGIVVLSIKRSISTGQVKYEELEQEVIKASKTYFKIENITIKDGYEKKINISILKNNNYIQNDLINDCKGFVIISRQKNSDDLFENYYSAYLQCGNKYKTVGYDIYE